jgi:hypothetical protein
MRLALVLVALALVAAGCGEDDEQAAAPSPSGSLAQLTVTVDNDGAGGAGAKTAEVSCDAAGDSKVCGAVSKLAAKVFEPTPGDVACTQQFGGPETATVRGTLNGEAVDAEFSRTDGCEISRWEKAQRLLEAAG